MPSFAISIDIGHLIPPGGRLTADAFPALAMAVREITNYAHQSWSEYAMGKPLPSGLVIGNRTGEYARSIQVRETGPFSGEVFSALAYARAIEEGTPERDMKRMLDTSFKVRLTKAGKRYLIIPFRHDRHSGLPDGVADWWKQAERGHSHITGAFQRASGTGAFDIKTRKAVTVSARTYHWGDRLGKAELGQLGVTDAKAKRLVGMVSFRNPGGSAGGGAPAGSHGQLITFRRMVEGSKGWIAKAQPGKFPARTVADQIRPLAQAAFEAALKEDIETTLGR